MMVLTEVSQKTCNASTPPSVTRSIRLSVKSQFDAVSPELAARDGTDYEGPD